jgi:hypothetical protein
MRALRSAAAIVLAAIGLPALSGVAVAAANPPGRPPLTQAAVRDRTTRATRRIAIRLGRLRRHRPDTPRATAQRALRVGRPAKAWRPRGPPIDVT